ncbi:MAG: esterase-like activity of phytase family protein [Calothrix sp. MO_167.B42]|nr:esterase-like activity of phytase family protein [Calothrix sp. MO_167.B42]
MKLSVPTFVRKFFIITLASIVSVVAIAHILNTPAFARDYDFYGRFRRNSSPEFKRIATFPVFRNTDVEQETVAEIFAASEDGKTLVYTDSETQHLCFVDITSPKNPEPLGCVGLNGEPTSVAVKGKYALVAVNTSEDFVNTSGEVAVVNIKTQNIVQEIPLGGQPDCIAVSPDNKYAAIAIENERDEDLGDGVPPQAPGGSLDVMDLDGKPENWTVRNINLDGVAQLFPNDAEPEYVDINDKNVAVVTFQENNHIALVDLLTGNVTNDFSAGSVNLTQIDTKENNLIELNSSLSDIPREPDGVNWIGNGLFATADEGDLNGGSRGFTIYNTRGRIIYSSGNSIEHEVVRLGHYPEERSENKGNEPENVEYGAYGRNHFLFVGSERSNIVLVYRLNRGFGFNRKPQLVQVLPTGVGPEGLLAIPQRNLFIAASEVDDRGDKIRSGLSIYKLGKKSNYPKIVSSDRSDGTPIPWGALSGLAASPNDKRTVFTIHDSFYNKSRIYAMNVRKKPAVIEDEIILKDTLGKLKAVAPNQVNDDGTVNLDPEGIAARKNGSFWIASEGGGSADDDSRPVTSRNLLLRVSPEGIIREVVTLPNSVNARQRRFGYEGIASVGRGENEVLYVAFQREWVGDSEGFVRIGRYKRATGKWKFYYYPLDEATSPNGGWVGLSDITYLGNDKFAVIERDNQGNTDARIKRIYQFSIAGLTPLADGKTPNFPVVKKKLVRDLLPDLKATGGSVLEKIEGLTLLHNGKLLVVNDNDGVDDSNGETQLLRL